MKISRTASGSGHELHSKCGFIYTDEKKEDKNRSVTGDLSDLLYNSQILPGVLKRRFNQRTDIRYIDLTDYQFYSAAGRYYSGSG